MTTPELCIAWDRLATGDAFGAVLGFVPTQKTTKTLCQRRVPMARIAREDNPSRPPTCPACIAEAEQREREHAALAESMGAELLRLLDTAQDPDVIEQLERDLDRLTRP